MQTPDPAAQSMEKQRSLDKLISVSKIFMDARVAELRSENENLRLQLFWKDYNVQSLRDVMERANNWPNSPKCNCLSCAVSGRIDQDVSTDNARVCTYVPWFEEKFVACGLTSGYALPTSTYHPHMSDTWNSVCDVDCHLVNIGRGDWVFFKYGKRLYQAQTVDDPELKKLQNLFHQLDADALHVFGV